MTKRELIPNLDLGSIEKIYHETIENVLNPPLQMSALPKCSANLGNSSSRTEEQVKAAHA